MAAATTNADRQSISFPQSQTNNGRDSAPPQGWNWTSQEATKVASCSNSIEAQPLISRWIDQQENENDHALTASESSTLSI
jgi:hypothetical protein